MIHLNLSAKSPIITNVKESITYDVKIKHLKFRLKTGQLFFLIERFSSWVLHFIPFYAISFKTQGCHLYTANQKWLSKLSWLVEYWISHASILGSDNNIIQIKTNSSHNGIAFNILLQFFLKAHLY